MHSMKRYTNVTLRLLAEIEPILAEQPREIQGAVIYALYRDWIIQEPAKNVRLELYQIMNAQMRKHVESA